MPPLYHPPRDEPSRCARLCKAPRSREPPAELVREQVERREREQREERRGDEPADHYDREGAFNLGPVEPEHEEWEQPEDGRRRRHELRPYPPDARLPNGRLEGHPIGQ